MTFTKYDTYAALTRLGAKRGFSVIPEFRIAIPGTEKTKVIDLVWAMRQGVQPRKHSGEPHNHAGWDIYTAIEIEGSNVPEQTIEAHIDLKNGYTNLRLHIALYTARGNWTTNTSIDNAIRRRETYSEEIEIRWLVSPDTWVR